MENVTAILGSAANALTLRQQVLGNDIANANTPDFHSQSVDFSTALDGAVKSRVVTEPGMMTANGNGVDLEQTLISLEQTSYGLQGVETLLSMNVTTQTSVINNLQGA